MSRKKKLEDAYVASKSYCGCKQGKYLQPVTGIQGSSVNIQGITVLTENDNIIGENIPNFVECKLSGKCKLIDGEKIKWEKVTEDVKIKGSKALNGMSYFKCPHNPSEEINFYDHQQNKLSNGKIEAGDKEGKVNSVENKSGVEKVGDYLGKSIKQVVMGEFTEDTTLLGTAMEFGLGLTGLDLLMDIRDFIACTQKGDLLGMGLAAFGMIPVIGSLKSGFKAFKHTKSIGKALEASGKTIKRGVKQSIKSTGNLIENIGQGVIRNYKNTVEYLKYIDIRKIADDILEAGEKIVVRGKEKWQEIIEEFLSIRNIFCFIGCFSGETLVKGEKGYKKIEDIEKGEYVYSYNELTGKEELKRVLEIMKVYEKGETLKLKFSNGVTLETTRNHIFMTVEGDWKSSEELEVGERIYRGLGEEVEILSKEEVSNETPKIMYDLEIEDNHNYYVSELDILTHNGNCPRAIAKQLEKIAKEIEDGIRSAEEVYEIVSYAYKKKLDELAEAGEKLEIKRTVKGEEYIIEYEKIVEEFNVNGITVKASYYSPIFNDYRKFEIPFGEELGVKYGNHFGNANKYLQEKLKDDPNLFGKGKKVKFIEGSTTVIIDGKVYTWHHNLKTKTLELVLQDAHKAGRHMGAGSVITIIQEMFK